MTKVESINKSKTFAKNLLEQASNEGLTVNEFKMALNFAAGYLGDFTSAAKISVLPRSLSQ